MGGRADFYVAHKDGIQRRQSRKFAGAADCLFYWCEANWLYSSGRSEKENEEKEWKLQDI